MTREERNKIGDKIREARMLCDQVRVDMIRGRHNKMMRERLEKAQTCLTEVVDIVFDIGTHDMAMDELTAMVRDIHKCVVPRPDMCYNPDRDESEESEESDD